MCCMTSDAAGAATSTIQLRRYEIEPGRMADHVAWFPTIRAVREKYGYKVLFALADAEHGVFTWAVAIDGDMEAFLAVDAVYNESTERAAAFATNPKVVTSLGLTFVTDVLAA